MKNAFRILIVEDELMIAEMTKEMLLDLGYEVIGIAKNYDRALHYLDNDPKIDLAILDINLNQDVDGTDIAKYIKEKIKIPFIFLTSYSDPGTVKKASGTKPSAYILKPYTKGDLFTTIEIIKSRKQDEVPVVIKDGEYSVKINSNDISYIKSDNNYLELFTPQKKYLVRNSLENFLSELSNPNFIRIHRSYAINSLRVEAINGQQVIVDSQKCPISRSHKQELMELFRSRP